MLPAYYRFRVLNKTDQILTYANGARVDVKATPWKMTAGAMAYGTAIEDSTSILNTGETIAVDGEAAGDVHNNSSDKFCGLKGVFKIISDQTSTDGAFYLYMEESPDNVIWPSDLSAFSITKHCILVAVLEVATTGTNKGAAVNFEI